MRQIFISCVVFISLFATNIEAQSSRTKKIQHRSKNTAVAKNDAPFPGYTFLIGIQADKSLTFNVLTGFEYVHVDNALMTKALVEYVMMQKPVPGRKPAGPRVFIRPDESLDVNTVIEVIKAARVSDSSEVVLELPGGPRLTIPADPSLAKDVKPNPLTLVVAVRDNETVTLNNENYGTLSDLSLLTKKLREVFVDRERYGAWRAGTTEVEKTVYIKMLLPVRVADLIKIAKALESAGAGPLGLQVDDLPEPTVELRRKLIEP